MRWPRVRRGQVARLLQVSWLFSFSSRADALSVHEDESFDEKF